MKRFFNDYKLLIVSNTPMFIKAKFAEENEKWSQRSISAKKQITYPNNTLIMLFNNVIISPTKFSTVLLLIWISNERIVVNKTKPNQTKNLSCLIILLKIFQWLFTGKMFVLFLHIYGQIEKELTQNKVI